MDGTNWSSTLDDVAASDSTKLEMETGTKSIIVHWKWEYEQTGEGNPATSDAADTILGINGSATLAVTAAVTVTQIDESDNLIPSRSRRNILLVKFRLFLKRGQERKKAERRGAHMKRTKKKSLLRKVAVGVLAVLVCAILYAAVYSAVMRVKDPNGVPMPFGFGVSLVLSGSMEPEISTDDLVFLRKADAVRVGDVVLYDSGTGRVLHRVIRIEGGPHYHTGGCQQYRG